jgi:hypothetical protein
MIDDRPAAPPGDAPDAERRSWLRELGIYAVMIVAALAAIGYTSTGGPRVLGFGPAVVWVWIAIVPIYFLACVWHGWDRATTRKERGRLVATQALHWLAFAAAMHIVLLPDVQGVLNDNARGLALLLLLGMGTFLAGVHAWSLPICITGVLLVLAIPLLAWIEQTAILLLVLAGGAGVVFLVLWILWRRHRAAGAAAAA